ncbi:hypothetical protein PPYR_02091 [Photinus pyralis]|uniref:YqaJ viral recombinase domain-containing protein n=1 Tax=Photinus pyralis TaxID=7054 RepID=A0A5N4B681_PHOPY|nr:hypothetical protein PPYR_02091 [Photinus pyralis]
MEPAGLYVDFDHGFLGASPDGLVGSTHLVEVKCLYSVHKSGKTLEEAAKSETSLCLSVTDGKVQLKRNHKYFYQIQGQLNICQREACYFVVLH